VPTICVPDADTAAALADLKSIDPELRILVWDSVGPMPDGIDQVEFYVPPYVGRVTSAEDLGRMPALKVLQVLTAGVERWLPMVGEGVIICNGRGIHGAGTAELALAGILNHLRELPRFAAAQQRAEWDSEFTAGLRGRRVLILGAGDIGTHLAAALEVFGAKVTLVARRPRDGIRGMDELSELLPTSQIVTIALPNTPETSGLVDAKFLAAMPDGALLVNVARGPLVVTEALLVELSAQRLYAFLDVFETEPLPSDHPLWRAPNVVMTPHIGGGSVGWERVATELVVDQVRHFLRGEPLANVVSDGY
jgi:phosphoglycerate dehydrogenase-like enzyme